MSELPPNVRPPTRSAVEAAAERHRLDLDEESIDLLCEHLAEGFESFETLEAMSEPAPERAYHYRNPGHRPDEDSDPLNAVARRCRVPGADDGPLGGVTVGLKDNVAVAGIEMACGSRLLSGYVPSIDAPIVTRFLDAGATITAKTTPDDLAHTGTGETPASGPVRNPHDRAYLAGGSSGGSAAAVVEGTVDVAVGTDTGGSIRIPASWCGCVGLKPTAELVPFEGIVHLAPSLDHAGPMARSVEDCARTLSVMAGPDAPAYADVLANGADGLCVGVLEEAFAFDAVESAVSRTVTDAAESFASMGADVDRVSVPVHEDGLAIHGAVAGYEITRLIANDGLHHSTERRHDPSFYRAFGDARRARADDLPFRLKSTLVAGEIIAEEHSGVHYAKASNLRFVLADAYDEALEDRDVLALPTTPTTAKPVNEDLDRETLLFDHVPDPNTAQFNLTGHPAVTVPCGTIDGLPVGLMLVGRRGDDATVLRAAGAFESNEDWTQR